MQDVERLLESKQWGVQAQQTVWWRSDQAVADGAFRICCQPFDFNTPAVSWEENVAVWGILPWIYDIWLLSCCCFTQVHQDEGVVNYKNTGGTSASVGINTKVNFSKK